MFDYIQKFNNLSQEVREKISAFDTVKKVEKLEDVYDLNLAPLIMKVMVLDVKINQLREYLMEEMGLEKERAERLKKELIDDVFSKVADYLGIEIKNKELEDDINTQVDHQDKGGFSFSQEEEKEAQGLADKIRDYEELDPLRYQIEHKADKIIKEADINFSSEFLFSRLRKILIIYLRSVRNQVNTKQTLFKDVASGGLELEELEADKILDIAKREKIDLGEEPYFHPQDVRYTKEYGGQLSPYKEKKIISKEKEKSEQEQLEEKKKINNQKQASSKDADTGEKMIIQENKQKSPGIDLSRTARDRDIDYDLKSVLENKQEQRKETPKINQKKKEQSQKGRKENIEKGKKEEKKGVFSTKTPKDKDKVAGKEREQKQGQAQKQDQDKKAKQSFKEKKKQFPRSKKAEGKQKMEDIKPAPKAMSSLDELRYMDVVTFRRLAEDSNEKQEKIKKKIDLLGKESLGKMFDGIKAWRQSPVNKMYISMGKESINNNKDIKTIIREKKSHNQDYLIEAEFNAILELNKKLRFY